MLGFSELRTSSELWLCVSESSVKLDRDEDRGLGVSDKMGEASGEVSKLSGKYAEEDEDTVLLLLGSLGGVINPELLLTGGQD